MEEVKIQEPFFNVTITGKITLQSNQINNQIRSNIKENFIEKYKGKNFKNIGTIMQIYDMIGEVKGGKIQHENVLSTAVFDVSFNCKICRPIKNTFITCVVKSINLKLIDLHAGSIIVTHRLQITDLINKDKFKMINDDKQSVLYGYNESKAKLLKDDTKAWDKIVVGSYIKVKVLSFRISNEQKNIICKGFLEQLSTDEEIKNYKEIENGDI